MFEGLKKLWQQARKKAEEVKEFAEDDNRIIKMPPAVFGHEHETMPVDLSPGNEQGTPIDKEIAALVGEMNRVGIHTTCSCQGEVGQDGAYISIHVGEGTTYDYRDDTKELTLRWRRG